MDIQQIITRTQAQIETLQREITQLKADIVAKDGAVQAFNWVLLAIASELAVAPEGESRPESKGANDGE